MLSSNTHQYSLSLCLDVGDHDTHNDRALSYNIIMVNYSNSRLLLKILRIAKTRAKILLLSNFRNLALPGIINHRYSLVLCINGQKT